MGSIVHHSATSVSLSHSSSSTFAFASFFVLHVKLRSDFYLIYSYFSKFVSLLLSGSIWLASLCFDIVGIKMMFEMNDEVYPKLSEKLLDAQLPMAKRMRVVFTLRSIGSNEAVDVLQKGNLFQMLC